MIISEQKKKKDFDYFYFWKMICSVINVSTGFLDMPVTILLHLIVIVFAEMLFLQVSIFFANLLVSPDLSP